MFSTDVAGGTQDKRYLRSGSAEGGERLGREWFLELWRAHRVKLVVESPKGVYRVVRREGRRLVREAGFVEGGNRRPTREPKEGK